MKHQPGRRSVWESLPWSLPSGPPASRSRRGRGAQCLLAHSMAVAHRAPCDLRARDANISSRFAARGSPRSYMRMCVAAVWSAAPDAARAAASATTSAAAILPYSAVAPLAW